MSKKQENATEGRFAYDGLDRSLHEKARLGIMTSLLTRTEGLLFTEIKQLCRLTDGNLSRHIQVLHDQRLVEVSKGFDKRRPQTRYRLTAAGRRRFLEYIAELEKVVQDASVAQRQRVRTAEGEPGEEPLPGLPMDLVPG